MAIVDSTTAASADWFVFSNTMGSDHCTTTVTIYNRKPYIELDGPARFNLSKADWRQFKDLCDESITTDLVVFYENIDIINSNITDAIISEAINAVFPPLSWGDARLSMYPYHTGTISVKELFMNEIAQEIN